MASERRPAESIRVSPLYKKAFELFALEEGAKSSSNLSHSDAMQLLFERAGLQGYLERILKLNPDLE